MTNENDNSNFYHRSIVTAFKTATTAGEMGRRYVLSRHHTVEKPRHSLDFTRVWFNTRPRDDGRASAMVLA